MTAAARLPSGRAARAALSKDDVTRHQRERILRAMASAVAQSGYATTTVSDVIARAGVSRATFYEQFADKQDCFLGAFDLALDVLAAGLRPPPRRAGAGSASFADLLRRYLDGIVADHELARVFLVDIHALGAAGVAHRAGSQQRFVDAIAALFAVRTEQQRFACEVLVAAIGSMVTARLAADDLDGIRRLHRPLVGVAEQLLPTPRHVTRRAAARR